MRKKGPLCRGGKALHSGWFFSFLRLRIVLLFLRFLVLPESSFDSSFDDKIADGGVDRDASGEEEDGEKIIHAAYLLCLLRLLRER